MNRSPRRNVTPSETVRVPLGLRVLFERTSMSTLCDIDDYTATAFELARRIEFGDEQPTATQYADLEGNDGVALSMMLESFQCETEKSQVKALEAMLDSNGIEWLPTGAEQREHPRDIFLCAQGSALRAGQMIGMAHAFVVMTALLRDGGAR